MTKVSTVRPRATQARSTKPRVEPNTAGDGPRVVAVFGPPSCGVTTVCEVLKTASKTPMTIIPYEGIDAFDEMALRRAQAETELVILDVAGGLFGPKDVQELNDRRIIFRGNGAIVRLYLDNEETLIRAQSRPGYINYEDLRHWTWEVPKTEALAASHGMRFFMLPNYDLEQAARLLALRCGVFK